MKANITISNIYWNKSLSGFFFRDQSYTTLEKLVNNAAISGEAVLNTLDEQTDDEDIDDVEEDFFNMTVGELAEQYGIELEEGDDDDENDDL